jgi:hypothetical protein
MNERIKELAEQAGIAKDFAISGLWLAEEEELERFAELIRLDETKACAKHYLEIMRDAVEQARKDERERVYNILISGDCDGNVKTYIRKILE